MAQICFTPEERVRAVQRFGYSEREATFLCHAALHGGYFLRRQYLEFLGKSPGGIAADLIEKVLGKGHARGTLFAKNTHIYHLSARALYGALGQEDNRNRRLVQPITIKSRLMILDFVLDRLNERFLSTEQEKIDFFTRGLGLERALLPAKRYTTSGKVTERFFIEKFPVFLTASTRPAQPPIVTFVFMDSGEATLSALWTFLERHALLFTRLREFRFMYVAANSVHFEAAEKAFTRFCAATLNPQRRSQAAETVRILAHFEARRLYERHEWSGFDRARLVQFRNDRQIFSGDWFDALYHLWTTHGPSAVESVCNSEDAQQQSVQATFSTVQLNHDYDIFGTISAY